MTGILPNRNSSRAPLNCSLDDEPVVSWSGVDGANIASLDGAPPVWHSTLPHSQRGQIDCYTGSYSAERESQDAFLVMREPGRDVLAVADGVTPTARQTEVWSLEPDGAAFAARMALLMLEQFRHLTLAKAFEQANGALMAMRPKAVCRPRDRPQTAVAAAEILYTDSGAVQRINICRAADCDVWVRRGGSWTLVTSEDMVQKSVRDQLNQWDADHPNATLEERLSFEFTLPLDDADSWNCTALGRFDGPELCTDTIRDAADVSDLLVVTDGARLRCREWLDADSPDAWVRELRLWERRSLPVTRPHSDVAMLWLRCPRAVPP